MEILLIIIIFILGLCFGSFVNMLVYRVAMKYRLRKGDHKSRPYNKNRSFCDYCGRQLKWYENIPVVSWLMQKGKTRCCRKKLSVLYPIVEMMTGVLFVIFYRFQISDVRYQVLELIFGLVILVFLIFSGVFDLKYMILPDFSTIILVTLAVIGIIIGRPQESPVQFILAAVGAFGFLGFLYLITQKKGMGFGDVKLAFFMGLFLGYPKIIVAFYVAFVVGAVISLILIIIKKAGRKTLIPFGPFLILGTLVAWFFGDEIISMSVFSFIR